MRSRIIAAFVIWGLLLVSAGAGAPFLLADPDQCPDLYTDFSLQCSANVTDCGSYCFYADCIDCEDDKHRDHGTHEHCDSDSGSCSSHRNHPTHWFEISPCISWKWYLYDPQKNRVRRQDEYISPNLNDALDLGFVPEGYTTPVSPCRMEDGDTQNFAGGQSVLPTPVGQVVSSSQNSKLTLFAYQEAHPLAVTTDDLTHLPTTPGEVGAPSLDTLNKNTDYAVQISATPDDPSHTIQYRYWAYNGVRVDHDVWSSALAEKSPSELRAPFTDLTGPVTITDVRGIISFQVRGVDVNGVATGYSNIKHAMVGMDRIQTLSPTRRSGVKFDIALPTPPPYGTPLPTIEGVARPFRPIISSAVQLPSPPSPHHTVEVKLGAAYTQTVEHRWWYHSGFGPTDLPRNYEEWRPVTLSGGKFTVSDMIPDTPEAGGLPTPTLFNLQVRLVDANDIMGDPSGVVVIRVWGGDFANFGESRTVIPPTLTGRWTTPTPTPALVLGQGLDPDCGTAVTNTAHEALSYECARMLDFKNRIDPEQTLNWSKNLTIYSWDGVGVSGSPPRVQRLELGKLGLTDTTLKRYVPSGLSSLSELKKLVLNESHFAGSLPGNFTTLPKLESIDLRDNNLSGALPDFSAMPLLLSFRADENSFSGTLLGKFDGLTKLEILTLKDNLFSGTVPADFAGLTALELLYLEGNSFDTISCYHPSLLNLPDNDLDQLSVAACDEDEDEDD